MPTKYTFAYSIPSLKKNEVVQALLASWSDKQDRSSWIKHACCQSSPKDVKTSFYFYVLTHTKLSIEQNDEVVKLLTDSGATHVTILIAQHPAK